MEYDLPFDLLLSARTQFEQEVSREGFLTKERQEQIIYEKTSKYSDAITARVIELNYRTSK